MGYFLILILFVLTALVIPARWDLAIRLKEWNYREEI